MDPQLVDRATALLQALTGRADARLRDDQLDAIDALVADRRRVLLVQRTGWGKSAVYFIATKLLREAGSGPTILVSPLLALMRNQIDAAARMGVRAASLNSSNRDEWAAVQEALDRDEVDVLLVAPERFANRSPTSSKACVRSPSSVGTGPTSPKPSSPSSACRSASPPCEDASSRIELIGSRPRTEIEI